MKKHQTPHAAMTPTLPALQQLGHIAWREGARRAKTQEAKSSSAAVPSL